MDADGSRHVARVDVWGIEIVDHVLARHGWHQSLRLIRGRPADKERAAEDERPI